MRHSAKKILLFSSFLLIFSIHSFATHIVGGDLTVKWLNGNNFEITVQFFRDCGPGNAPFDPFIAVGVYDKVTDAQASGLQQTTSPVITTLTLGDGCYTPSMCIEKAVYKIQISIPNNPNGYYITWLRCCRNGSIANIVNPLTAGYVMYTEIPDPALHNSSPTFSSIPDGYMCNGYPNKDNFACTDIDGDQLKYSFSTPLNCSTTTACSTNNNTFFTAPKPYGTISWVPGYSLANPVGDPKMTIDSTTGMVSTFPPNMGIYVFCVKVEEFRAGVKIGEIQRDFQFQVLPCQSLVIQNTPVCPSNICLGKSQTLTGNSMGAGFTYLWSPGGQTTTSIVVTPTAAGTYTYSLSATNGSCQYTASIVTTVNQNPVQSYLTANNIPCYGGVGSAFVNPLSGTAPYTYQWLTAPVQTTDTISGLSPGTYTVIIQDANTCSSTKTVTITQPSAGLAATALVTNDAGCNLAVGSASVSPTGGTVPYSYSWNSTPIQTTKIATGLFSASYLVIVKDANGCTTSSSVYVPVANGPSVTATSVTNAGCNLAIGTAALSTTGGTPPYTYLWSTSPVQTTQTVTGLFSGNYTVITKDAKSCSTSLSVYIPVTSSPSVTTTLVNHAGCNLAIGSAAVSPFGGIPPYSYVWSSSPVQTTQIATGLYAGLYSITTTDSYGCSVSASMLVPAATGPSVTATAGSIIACNGNHTGSASVTSTTGGLPPYTFFWNSSPVQTTSIATGLSANILYTATVTDANNCSSSSTIMLSQPAELLASVSANTMPACFGYSNGNASVSVSGGTIGSGYTYYWTTSPLQTTATATGLVAGNYTVTVLDVNGCSITLPVSVSQPAAITLNTSISGFSCAGTSPNGQAASTAGGGTPPYSYLWKPGNMISPSISNLTAGTFSVTVTDSHGCSLSETATINPSTKPDAQFSTNYVLSCEEVTMQFRDESSPSSISSWNWNFGDGQSSSVQNPSHTFPYEIATYNVTLIVADPPCYDTVKTNIKVGDMLSYTSFEAANIFSPNGDGVNDCFTPAMIWSGADELKECVSIEVFDRWGIKMFESTSAGNCWDGNNKKDNKPAADGVYFYIAGLGKTTIKGYVTLIRHRPG